MSKVHVYISITEFYEEYDEDAGGPVIHEAYWNTHRDLGVFEDIAEAKNFIMQCSKHNVNLYGCNGDHEIIEKTRNSWLVEMHDPYKSYAEIDFREIA